MFWRTQHIPLIHVEINTAHQSNYPKTLSPTIPTQQSHLSDTSNVASLSILAMASVIANPSAAADDALAVLAAAIVLTSIIAAVVPSQIWVGYTAGAGGQATPGWRGGGGEEIVALQARDT